MSESRELVNLDKLGALPQRDDCLKGILMYRDGWPLLYLLTVPSLKKNILAPDFSSRLVTLPQEIFDMIVRQLHDPTSVLRLALTCSYFWRVLPPQVKEAICILQAPWAGDRLFFVSSDAAILSPLFSQFEARQRSLKEASGLENGQEDHIEVESFLRSTRTIPQRPSPLEILLFDGIFIKSLEEEIVDCQLFLRLLTTLRRHPGYKRTGVLRNLTKQQYVLDSKLAATGFQFSLGDILLLRIHWTEDYEEDRTEYRLGDWAGDRFDIRTIEDCPVGWTDVSDEIIALLYEPVYHYSFSDVGGHEVRAWVE